MLQKTRGIVLRSIKYGETSLIINIFTETYGLCAYMVQGVRSSQKRNSRTGLLQVASLLDFVAEHKPGRNLQHIREFQAAFIYTSIQEEIIKNSIATFSVELLQRLLPQEEIMPDLFDFAYHYFISLDNAATSSVANYPLFFIIQCGKHLGYNVLGNYSAETPYLDSTEGTFSNHPPMAGVSLLDSDIATMDRIINTTTIEQLTNIPMNAAIRNRLLDWYIQFLQHHTQHLSGLKSLEILRMILH